MEQPAQRTRRRSLQLEGLEQLRCLPLNLLPPKVPPCSFAGAIFEMKLGTTVRITPMPEAIIVNARALLVLQRNVHTRSSLSINLGREIP